MKKVLKALLALVVVLVALVLAHPIWIGPVVRTAVSQLAPKFLGVPARLDGFSLNAYTGRVTLDGFALDNPPGCRERQFVTVGHLTLDVDPMTVLSDPIVVEEISLADLYVSLVTDEKRTYNFTTVAETVSPSDAKPDARRAQPAEPKEKDGKPAPKVIIDLVQVRNALVQWERIPLPLPSFRLTGIGRSAGGVEFENAWKETETKFVGALGPLAKGLQLMLDGSKGSLDGGVKAAADIRDSVRDLRKAVGDGSADSVRSAAKKLEDQVKSLKSLFK